MLVESVVGFWTEKLEPDTPGEARFLRRLVEWGVDDAETQFELFDGDGAFVARFDVACPSIKHAYEYDTDLWHNPRRFDPDELRHSRAVALGWKVDHVSKVDLLPSATRIPALIEAARSRAEVRASCRTVS